MALTKVSGDVIDTQTTVSVGSINVGTGASISSPATNVLTLGTNNSEVIRVGATGFIGIGTTNPTEKLSVTGNIHLNTSGNYIVKNFTDNVEEYIFRGETLGSHNGFISYKRSTGTGERGFFFGSHDNNGTRIDSLTIKDGKVGIGITNPSSSLHVAGSRDFAPTQPGVHIGEGGTNDFALEICCRNSSANSYIDFTHPGQDYKGRVIKTMGGAFSIQNNEATSMTLYNNGDNRLIIDSSGRVTMPYQPSFRVGRSTNYNPGANTDIIFNVVSTHHHNTGNHYNTSNGRFNVPVTGKYLISFEIVWQDIPNNATMEDACYIFVNGAGAMFSFSRGFYVSGITGGSGYYVDFGTCILSLNATDYVTIRNHRNYTVHGNSLYTWFAGHLLG